MWAGYPDLGLWWLTPWVGLIPLLLAVPHLSARRAALAGWQAGCLCCGLTLVWLLGLIPIAGTIAVLGFVLLVPWLGALWGANAVLARWVILRWRPGALIVLPAAWACTEWLQNHLFTGFGWVFLGYTQSNNLPVLQLASVGGVYLVSWMIAAVNVLLWGALQRATGMRLRVAYLAGVAGLLAAVHVWGTARLRSPLPTGRPLRVGLVQGSFATEVKWDYRYAATMWDLQVERTRRAAREGTDVIVWSEAALGLAGFHRYEPHLQQLAREVETPLLVGANYYYFDAAGDERRVTNAVLAIAPDGTVAGPYDKRHLTPFGEYTPLKWLFPFLSKMIPAISDFSPGNSVRTLPFATARALPLICFESVFPHEVRAAAQATSPDLLVHVTNVGWFGRTIMPEQDLAVTRFRPVETGLPMVRAANVGISCVIDAHGRLTAVADSEYGRVFIDRTIVAEVTPGRIPTLYARVGDAFVLLCAVLAGVGAMLCYTRASRSAA